MYDHRPQQLMIIVRLTLRRFATTLRATDRAGGKLPRAIDRHQVMAVQVLVRLERFVPLQVTMHREKRRAQRLRLHRIKPRA